jgi:hypothetical protein
VADTIGDLVRLACTAEDRERLKVDPLAMAIMDTNAKRATGGQ